MRCDDPITNLINCALQLKSLRPEVLGSGCSARRFTLKLHRSVGEKQISASKTDMDNFLNSIIENAANKVIKYAADAVLSEDRQKIARKRDDVMFCS